MNLKRYFGDAYSITSYRDTMSRLRKVDDNGENDPVGGPPPHVRLVLQPPAEPAGMKGVVGRAASPRLNAKPAGTAQGSGTIRHLEEVAVRNPDPVGQVGRRRLLFIDESLRDVSSTGSGPAAPPGARSAELSVVRDAARPSDQKARSRAIVVALALTVLVGGGVSLLLLEQHHGTRTATGPTVTARRTATSGTPGQAGPASASATTAVPAHPPAPTGSAAAAVAASSIGSTSAAYTVSGATINLIVTASAPCWIDVRPAPSAPSIFTGTLTPGQRRAFSEGGNVWMRVGFPAGLRVVVNGSAIPLPAGSNPYNLSFNQARPGQ